MLLVKCIKEVKGFTVEKVYRGYVIVNSDWDVLYDNYGNSREITKKDPHFLYYYVKKDNKN